MDQSSLTPDELLARIAETPEVKERAVLVGLRREPFDEAGVKQECASCIYFLPHYRHCDLPELDFPVNADWWCRLWRC